MKQLTQKEEISKNFTFHYDDTKNGVDLFFCKCGHIIEKDRKVAATEMKITLRDGQGISDMASLFDENSMARFALKCDKCETDYSDRANYGMVQECDKKFFETYFFEETETDVKLVKQRFAGTVGYTQKRALLVVSKDGEPYLEVSEYLSWIRYSKVDKKLFFKDFEKEEQDFTLDKVMFNSRQFFFNGESRITDRLFEVHLFLNRMANFVSDSKNMNIVDELMIQMVGKSGLDIICKVASIFFGIICYPNLSTIALTKGTVFLFDMMNDCSLPNPQELSDNEATSPLKIFNYLVNNKNAEISKELDSHDHEKTGYIFKSEAGREFKFKYESEKYEQKQQTVTTKEGGTFLREDITKKSVSPYIFTTIEKFSDYKILIKYTKFISYNDLIDLVKKQNIKILINLMPAIEFRADMNLNKLNQIISLGISSLERIRNVSFNRITDTKYIRERVNFEEEPKKEFNIEDMPLDYHLLSNFDFTNYDDSLRMIRSLNWDANKEFYKIKTIDALEQYHDELTDHFNLLSNDVKNKDFVSFVAKYKVLEEYESKLKIRLIKTPETLLKYAKEMKNCSGSYVNRISSGQYLLCIVEDIDDDKPSKEPKEFMLGLIANKYGELEFDQIKAACNVQGSDRFKKNVMDYLQEKEIPYKELSDLRLSTERSLSNNELLDAYLRNAELNAQLDLPQYRAPVAITPPRPRNDNPNPNDGQWRVPRNNR